MAFAAPLASRPATKPRALTTPYALRALGQAHLIRNDPEGSLPFLRQAADTPPGDPITLYTLAQALMALDTPEHRKEADTSLTRALALGPPPDLAERLRQTHSRLARQVLRANADGQLRMDVVAYCASALQTYSGLSPRSPEATPDGGRHRWPEGPQNQRPRRLPPSPPPPQPRAHHCHPGRLPPLRRGAASPTGGGGGV